METPANQDYVIATQNTDPERSGAFAVVAEVHHGSLVPENQTHLQGIEEKGTIMPEVQENNLEFVNVTFPNKGYKGRDLISEPFPKEDPKWQRVKFPPHTPELTSIDGEVIDVSNHTFLVPFNPEAPDRWVKQFENDPNYRSVSFPATGRDGEPWTVNVRLEQGHWENPVGDTKEEKGAWIADDPIEFRVKAADLAPVMQQYREERREFKQNQYQERQQTRAQQKAQKAPAQTQAAPTSPTQDGEVARQSAQAQSKSAPNQDRGLTK